MVSVSDMSRKGVDVVYERECVSFLYFLYFRVFCIVFLYFAKIHNTRKKFLQYKKYSINTKIQIQYVFYSFLALGTALSALTDPSFQIKQIRVYEYYK